MRLGTEDRKKLPVLAVAGVLALGALYYMYAQLSTPSTPTPVASTPVVATAPRPAPAVRATVRAPSAVPLDPTLHMEAMLVTESLVYSGNGRNIFSVGPGPRQLLLSIVKPIELPRPITPVRTSTTQSVYGPPPIDLKFFGTEVTSGGVRHAFLLHGEDVFLVSSGDVVQRRYRVVRIDARTILMEDIANNDQQTLPLLSN